MTKSQRQKLLQKIHGTIIQTLTKHDERRRKIKIQQSATHYKLGMSKEDWELMQIKWNRLKLKDVLPD